jgi:hypothetical protein
VYLLVCMIGSVSFREIDGSTDQSVFLLVYLFGDAVPRGICMVYLYSSPYWLSHSIFVSYRISGSFYQ